MPTLSQIPLLAAMLGQRPVDEDSDADDAVTLEEPAKTILDPGEPTKRLRGLFDSLVGAMPNLRREQKSGVTMNAPVTDNGKVSSSVLDESVTGRSAEIAPPQPDVSSDVARQLAMANARRQESQQLADRSQRSEDVASHLSDLVNRFGEKPDLAKPLYQDFKEAGPSLAAVLMKPGADPGLMNGPSQKLGKRELNGYGQPLQSLTIREEPATPERLNARGAAKVAANPYDNLDSSDPEQASLQDKLAGMTLLHPEAQNVEQKQRAKDEAALQADLEARERIGDLQASARTRSQATSQNATQRNFLDTILGRTQSSGKTRQQELYDETMKEFRNRQTLANRNAGMGNSAAMYAGTSRYNAKLPGGVAKADPEAEAKVEFDARKQAVADKYAPEDNSTVKVLHGGSQVRWDTGRPKFVGPASGGNEERAAEYLAKISQQAGLSKPVASLDEFRQQQAANRQQNAQIAEDKSKRNLAAMILGRSGGALPKDADLNATRAFNTGRRRGPTYADMLQYNKDESAKKRAEADRDNKLKLLAQLNAANPDGKNLELKKKADMLAAEIGSGVEESGISLPEVTKRKTADELAGMTKPAVNEPKPLKSKTTAGQVAERAVGNLQESLEGMTPYDFAGPYAASLVNPVLGIPSLFNMLLGGIQGKKKPEETKKSAVKTTKPTRSDEDWQRSVVEPSYGSLIQ